MTVFTYRDEKDLVLDLDLKIFFRGDDLELDLGSFYVVGSGLDTEIFTYHDNIKN